MSTSSISKTVRAPLSMATLKEVRSSMILCHSLSSRESLILSTTHKWSASCLLASVLLILSTGCWSSPNTEGTWSGTVSRRTLYVDGKECQAVLFKSAEGSEISPQLGSGYLVDKNN